MEKYKKSIVYSYIYGNDIEDYTLEELESDPKFMSQVILLSKDKNFYDYVEKPVKQNYHFVKSLLEAFPGDDTFLIQAVETYLESNDNELNKIEVLIILCSIIKDKTSEDYIKYKLILRTKYLREKTELLSVKEIASTDPKIKREVGEGFWFIYDKYNHNKIVLDYYAKEMIKGILSEKYLEEQIHNNFKTPEELTKIGQKNYLINIISNYDLTLSSYISANPSLLNPSLKILERIQKNWNKYNEIKDRKLYENIYEAVHTYMNYEEPSSGNLFTEDEILYLLGEELNILDLIKKYDKLDEEYYRSLKEEIKEHPKEEYTFIEKKHYNNLKRIIENILLGEDPKDAYTLEEQQTKGEVIDLMSYKKRG